jgi:hypothetical protein
MTLERCRRGRRHGGRRGDRQDQRRSRHRGSNLCGADSHLAAGDRSAIAVGGDHVDQLEPGIEQPGRLQLVERLADNVARQAKVC